MVVSKGSTPLQALGNTFPFITSFINNMRKIEREMIQAIIDRKDWRKANTEVLIEGFLCSVYLHGNRIAEYDLRDMSLSVNNCGWFTPTTKSRINALTQSINGASHVFQKNYQWYIHLINGPTVEFNDGFYGTVAV